MSERYRIRAGVSGDVARVLALDRATELLPHWVEADYAKAVSYAHCHPGSDVSKAGVGRCLFVADVHSEIVGFVVAKVTVLRAEVLAELESVAVDAAERRAGIGRALCEPVIEWSQRQGATEMDLEVRSRSDAAINLYKRLGFVAIGTRGEYYRDPVDDAVLMRKRLEIP